MNQFFELTNQILFSRALYVAADLSIADYLHQKACSLSELATLTATDKASLERLLYYLTLNNVFRLDSAELYHNTDLSDFMRADHPGTIRPFLLHDDETRWNAIGNLGYSIKSGKPSFDYLYGSDYFSYLKKHSLLSSRFDEAMNIISDQEDSIIASSVGFEGTIADIGGGQGRLLKKIVSLNPQVSKAVLFDLPIVVENVHVEDSKLEKVAGSFFESINVNSDIFILKRVLHDWDDDKSLKILQNIQTAMNTDSRLFIIDGILGKSKDEKLLAAIDLLLLTIFGGVERNLNQFEKLINSARLRVVGHNSLTNLLSIIECVKI